MNQSHTQKKSATNILLGIAAAVLVFCSFCWLAYLWIFCRFYVPAGHMAIITSKTGKIPAVGKILVEKGERGIWKDVLPEGRHFLNPISYDVKIVPATFIPLGKVGIVISKVGKELPPGEIIAPDHESKGVWRDVLGPGVYRLNPEGYTINVIDAINIPAGYVGVVTSQTGKLPAPGDFAKLGEKGVLRDVLQPGLYYINPYAYQVNVIEIGMNQVTMTAGSKGESVFSAKSRLNTSNAALQKLEENTLNFQQELRKQNQNIDPHQAVRAGSFSNSAMKSPRKPVAAARVRDGESAVMKAPAEALSDTAQIFGVSNAVEFPSRDGFKVSLEMTVEFELLPEHIAKIYLLYGDLPQVVEKIILPQVLSISRLKGSSYGAQDFIMGEGREIFQKDLQEELAKTLSSKNIIVHNAIIRTVEIPMDILQPIRAVSLAREQNLTNMALQETAKKLGELNTETEHIEQRRREVLQETEKLVAMTAAESRREVATIDAEARRKVAEISVKRSELLAKTDALQGETAARVKFLTANEEALGEVLRAKILGGGENLSNLKAVETLSPKVKTQIIYAGEGTLWTDLTKGAISLPADKTPGK